MLVVEKTIWDDGDVDYNISIQDSRYDHNYTTIWGRIKSAMKLLFGKPVYYSDIYIDKPEKFKDFVEKLNRCIYNKERTVCDCLRYEKKMDREIFNKAIRHYISDSSKNVPVLMDYARRFRVSQKVKNIIGVWL